MAHTGEVDMTRCGLVGQKSYENCSIFCIISYVFTPTNEILQLTLLVKDKQIYYDHSFPCERGACQISLRGDL